LMELMGGTIGFDSRPGQGSTFWCRLWLEKPRSPAAPLRAVKAQAWRPRRRQFTALVAEDNIVNREVALRQLEKLGVAVESVGNGREAVDASARFFYDLILMDCQMPVMDGYTAAAQIRAREGAKWHTPIVAMTAHALEGDREKCLAAGMDDYIAKPVQVEDLAGVLAKWDVLLDAAALSKLRQIDPDGQAGFFRDIVRYFLEDTPRRRAALREACRRKDLENLRQIAHTHKGSCASLGARGMQILAARAEGLARSRTLGKIEPVLQGLEEEFQVVQDLLGREEGTYASARPSSPSPDSQRQGAVPG
jgi:CheY-like chemotaxis protein